MDRLEAWKLLIRGFLPKLSPPHGNLKLPGFYRYARGLKDKDKNMLRRMLACLDMHNIVKQDNKLTYALWTNRDKRANLIRQKNRRLFINLGLVKRGDGTHIHHRDGNINNNKRANLQIVDGKKHKAAHAKANISANMTCTAFVKQFKRYILKSRGSRELAARK